MDLFPRYQGKEIKITKNASEELWRCKKDLWKVLEIVEEGYPCSRSKRKDNIREMCVTRGNKVYKAVIADCGEYWLLIHFGMFGHKRR